MYGDPLVGILQIQAVKAGKYAGSFLRMYRDPLVWYIAKTGRQLRLENTQAIFKECTVML